MERPNGAADEPHPAQPGVARSEASRTALSIPNPRDRRTTVTVPSESLGPWSPNVVMSPHVHRTQPPAVQCRCHPLALKLHG